MTITRTADHLDAVCDLAAANGLTRIHESGPCYDGKLVIFADDAQAHEYLHGASSKDVGILVEITFNHRGEVGELHARVDGEPRCDITGKRGSAGERLLWTLQLFAELGAEPQLSRHGYGGPYEGASPYGKA